MVSDRKFIVVEYIFFTLVSIMVVGLSILSFYSYIFIPATLIMLSLVFFGISYVFDLKKKKNALMYISFIIGILLLCVAIFYTLVRTING